MRRPRRRRGRVLGSLVVVITLALTALVSPTGEPAWSSPVSGDVLILSPFGPRSDGFHPGLDLEASIGTAIKSVDDGRVIMAGRNETAGNYVVVQHDNGWQSFYLHLSRIAVGVGAFCWRGRVLGRSGNTGLSTGPHLHLAAFKNGIYQDPLKFLVRYNKVRRSKKAVNPQSPRSK